MGGQHYPVDKLLYKSIICQSAYPLHSDLHGGTHSTLGNEFFTT